MESFQDDMAEYKNQLKLGTIQRAYKGLMAYIMDLRTYLKNKYPDYFVSGSLYYGYMDMTYFSFYPASLKHRNLKIAIIFVHETFRFEAWLVGYNKQVQSKYWELFKESDWKPYHIVPDTKDVVSILEHVLVDNPDFRNLGVLTEQIESGTLQFIKDIEDFLSEREI